MLTHYATTAMLKQVAGPFTVWHSEHSTANLNSRYKAEATIIDGSKFAQPESSAVLGQPPAAKIVTRSSAAVRMGTNRCANCMGQQRLNGPYLRRRKGIPRESRVENSMIQAGGSWTYIDRRKSERPATVCCVCCMKDRIEEERKVTSKI